MNQFYFFGKRMLKQQIQQPPPQTQQHQLLPNLDMISPVNQSSLTYFDDVDHSLSMINFLNVVLILRLSIEWRPRILSNINKIDFMEKSILRRRIFSNNPNSASPIFISWQSMPTALSSRYHNVTSTWFTVSKQRTLL